MLITLATRPSTFKISCRWAMSLWVGFTFYSLICSQTTLGCGCGLTYCACFECTCNNWISFTLSITSRLWLNTFCMNLSLKMYFKWCHVTDSAWTNQVEFCISPLHQSVTQTSTPYFLDFSYSLSSSDKTIVILSAIPLQEQVKTLVLIFKFKGEQSFSGILHGFF